MENIYSKKINRYDILQEEISRLDLNDRILYHPYSKPFIHEFMFKLLSRWDLFEQKSQKIDSETESDLT